MYVGEKSYHSKEGSNFKWMMHHKLANCLISPKKIFSNVWADVKFLLSKWKLHIIAQILHLLNAYKSQMHSVFSLDFKQFEYLVHKVKLLWFWHPLDFDKIAR